MSQMDILAVIKDVILIISASSSIGFALNGLNKWKKEADGKVHLTAAYDFLESMYKVRSSIHRVRHNGISIFELPNGQEVSQKEVLTYSFRNRWQRLDDSLAALDAAKFKMQVYEGVQFENCVTPLYSLIEELNENINNIIDLSSDDYSCPVDIWKTDNIKDIAPIVFHVPILDGMHGSFADRLNRTLKDIESDIRGSLTKKN